MPSTSQAQQQFMGAELGRLRAGKKTQTGMSEKQLAEFASTPRTGLPKRAKIGKGQAKRAKVGKGQDQPVPGKKGWVMEPEAEEKKEHKVGKGQASTAKNPFKTSVPRARPSRIAGTSGRFGVGQDKAPRRPNVAGMRQPRSRY